MNPIQLIGLGLITLILTGISAGVLSGFYLYFRRQSPQLAWQYANTSLGIFLFLLGALWILMLQ